MADDELEALRARNRLLARQVVELGKLEQRLITVEREADSQTRRTQAFSRFALAVAGAGEVDALVGHGLELLLAIFPYEQGAGFMCTSEGELEPVAVRAAPGCEEESAARLAERRWPLRLGALPAGARALDYQQALSGDADLGAALACFEALSAPRGEASAPPGGQLLVLPVHRSSGAMVALLLLRKLPTRLSYLERLADARDSDFLGLAASHLQVALDNAMLMAARRRAEAELARSEARLRAILEQLPAGVMVTRDERVVYANTALGRTLGEPAAGLVGRPVADLIQREERAAAAALRALPGDGATRVLERRLVRADGSIAVVEETTLPLALEGQPAIVSIIDDLTEQRAMRTQLLQAERMAAVGVLAAGVAHEVNNPLSYVVLHLERLVACLTGELGDEARSALEGALRIRDIVGDLKTFSRVDERIEVVDIAGVLESVLAMAANELRHRARVASELLPGHTVRASAGRLGQVFLNLLVNAAQAIPEGEADRHEVTVSITRLDSEVLVSISDTGKGIAPSDLARIFDPFFSTKLAGSGLGLGLAISRNIVESFGGRIEVESKVGRGTRFVVRLPAVAATPGLPPEPPPAELPSRLRVLAIDDEPSILLVVSRLLKDCDVVGLSSGDEACVLLADDQRFDVILCDLMMPAGGGDLVHGWLSQHSPQLAERLVFMTGGTFGARLQDFVALSGRLVLNKPFTKHQLSAVIAAVTAVGAR